MGAIVFLCFFFSGASGLLFEVLWTRELGLVFGSTTLAISTVLSVFMGGLAAGSFLGGQLCRSDRSARLRGFLARPLRLYALAEAGVGAFALSVPFFLSYYPKVNALLWRTIGDHYAGLSLLRFLATALLLLLPTTLMGATLPLLSQHLAVQRTPGPGSAAAHVGSLFAANTAGAVLGTFLSGFVLLPRLGVTTTNYVGAFTNLSLALAIVVADAWTRRRARAADRSDSDSASIEPAALAGVSEAPLEIAAEAELDSAAKPSPPCPPTDRQRRLAVACYAISGGVAMIYQVLWTRALAIVLGSSVYSFTLILLAFLIGLAGGAAVAARLLSRRGILYARPVRALALVHALTLATALWSFLVLPRLPEVFLSLLRGASFAVDELLAMQFVLAALAIVPATLAMGCVMPLTIHVYSWRNSDDKTASAAGLGRDVGVAYAWNTLGAIVGSFAAGFIVLPALGLQRGLLLCALVTAGLSAALLYSEAPAAAKAVPRRRAPLYYGLLVMLSAGISALLLPRWNLTHFSSGMFRVSIARQVIYFDDRRTPELLYYRDGISTTVSVERWGKQLALKNNGKVDASNGDDMSTQIMVGLMPLLFHPTALDRPPRAAIVGFGSGVTAGAVTQFPIEHADVIELEPAVVEAGERFFAEVNHRPSHDSRVRVIAGDGRNFMTQSDSRYDVIVSEPSNPWIAGVSNLFTVDYWRLARSRLAPDGIFCQWAQLYELSQPNVKTLLRSFASVFPYTYVFAAEHRSSDVILIASPRPLPLDVARLSRNFTIPTVRAELGRAGFKAPEDILADLLLVPDELPAYTAGAVINTDDNARIEFLAPRDLLGYLRNELTQPGVYSPEWPYGRFERYLAFPPGGLAQQPRGEFYTRLGKALLRHGKRVPAGRLLVRALGNGAGENGGAADRLTRLLALFDRRNIAEQEEALSRDWDGDDAHFASGLAALQIPEDRGLSAADKQRIRRDYAAALRALNEQHFALALRALRDWPMTWVELLGPDVRLVLGYLLYKTDLLEDARDHLEVVADEPKYSAWLKQHPSALYYLARAEYIDGDPESAVEHMERYIDLRD
jgi:spermidine synthase